jgi:hypothetical protein
MENDQEIPYDDIIPLDLGKCKDDDCKYLAAEDSCFCPVHRDYYRNQQAVARRAAWADKVMRGGR